MITYDEETAEEIYRKKYFRGIFRICCIWLGAFLILFCFVFMSALSLALFGFLWSGNFPLFKLFFGFIPASVWGLLVLLPLCLSIFFSIKFYFKKINCWVERDKLNFYIVGYLRGKKVEQTIKIKDVKNLKWKDGYFSYRGKDYKEVTLVTNIGEKIKNIPVEYKSGLYNYLEKLRKTKVL